MKGSGAVSCECDQHRDRCLFGRQHTWSLATVDHHTGEPLDTPRFHCMDCDSYCDIDPKDF
jgi:hypothetical protein